MITTDNETAIRGVILATVAAWNANDADAFAALYANDATVVLQGGTFLQGRDEIRGYMRAGFAGRLKGTRGSDEQVSVRPIGDAAVVVVSLSGFLLPGEETPAPERVRRATWTLARHDSEWLVEAYHNCPV
jgi:uncharacterized protein (TIGR02246 family)